MRRDRTLYFTHDLAEIDLLILQRVIGIDRLFNHQCPDDKGGQYNQRDHQQHR
jgi:hypothetical protein